MKILPWPNLARIAFAIRDDDISFFTPPEKLQIIYRNAFSKKFKVSLSVIPMHKATKNPNVPPNFRGKNKCYRVDENKPLVEYISRLTERKRIDVLQHGYTHDGSSRCPEFLLHKKEAEKIVRSGKAMLEASFGKIKVFVPPWNFLTYEGWKAIARENLSLSTSTLDFLRCTPPVLSKIRTFLNLFAFAITGRYCFPIEVTEVLGVLSISSLYGHYGSKYRNNESAKKTFRSFKRLFESVYSRNGCLVITNHYWHYFVDWEDRITSKLLKQYFDHMLDYVNGKKCVWKAGVGEIVDRLKLIRTVKVYEKRDKAVIYSPHETPNLTVQLYAHERLNEQKMAENYHEVEGKDGIRCVVLNMKADQKVYVRH